MHETVIGLTGPSGVGKDTLTRAMQHYPLQTVVIHSKIALCLRALTYLLQGLDIAKAGDRDYEARHGVVAPMIAVSREVLDLDQTLWVDAEAHLRARLLQDLVSRGTQKALVIISDVRHEHEQRAIEQSGGIVVELRREGIEPNPDRLDGLIRSRHIFPLSENADNCNVFSRFVTTTTCLSRNLLRSPTETQILRRLTKAMDCANLGGPDDSAQVFELAWQYLRSLNPHPAQPNALEGKP